MSRRGDFERMVRQHGAELSRLAYMLTGDPHDADDLAADVLLAAWHRWDRVSSAENPVAYLRRTTANMAASRIRRRRLWRSKAPLLQADVTPVRAPDGLGVDVRRALAHLPPRRRACVVLRFVFDLSEREVADTLGISVGTVKSQTSKGMSRLKVLLSSDAAAETSSTAPATPVDGPTPPAPLRRPADGSGAAR